MFDAKTSLLAKLQESEMKSHLNAIFCDVQIYVA